MNAKLKWVKAIRKNPNDYPVETKYRCSTGGFYVKTNLGFKHVQTAKYYKELTDWDHYISIPGCEQYDEPRPRKPIEHKSVQIQIGCPCSILGYTSWREIPKEKKVKIGKIIRRGLQQAIETGELQ